MSNIELQKQIATLQMTVQGLTAGLQAAKAQIAMLRDAVEKDASTYNIPLTARLCEALTATESTTKAYMDKRLNEEAEACAKILEDGALPQHIGVMEANNLLNLASVIRARIENRKGD